MDKKRNILVRELMDLIEEAKGIQSQIDQTFRSAYAALQKANMENWYQHSTDDFLHRTHRRHHPH